MAFYNSFEIILFNILWNESVFSNFEIFLTCFLYFQIYFKNNFYVWYFFFNHFLYLYKYFFK